MTPLMILGWTVFALLLWWLLAPQERVWSVAVDVGPSLSSSRAYDAEAAAAYQRLYERGRAEFETAYQVHCEEYSRRYTAILARVDELVAQGMTLQEACAIADRETP